MKLSTVVLTHNEEKNVGECLASLAFADEIIVIDDNSIDQTIEKVKGQKAKVKIFQRKLNNNFAAQRNYALSKATCRWVLFVDADERVSEALASELSAIGNQRSVRDDGFYIKRRDFLWGRQLRYGETGNIRLLRLAKRNSGRWRRRIHEVWEVKGNIGELANPLLHYPHRTLRIFINHINEFSTLHAEENTREGKKSSLIKIIFWPVGKFVYNYLIRLGFLDGRQGLVVTLMMSFHSFLAWSKLWIRQKKIK